MYLNDSIIIPIPIPAANPVKSRIEFLLFLHPKYCVVPSINVGMMDKKPIKIKIGLNSILNAIKIIKHENNPIYKPVHLAHTGK